MISVELALLTAIALFFSTFSSSALLSVVLTVGIFVAGLVERRPAALQRPGGARPAGGTLVTAIGWVVPAFSLFDVKSQVVHGYAVAAGRIVVCTLAYAASTSRVAIAGAVRSFRAASSDEPRLATFTGAIAIVVGLGLAAAHAARAARRALPPPVTSNACCTCSPAKAPNDCRSSFDALVSDLYWIRTIQHYGRDQKSSRRPAASSCCIRCSI